MAKTIKKITVSNMSSPSYNGGTVANQFIITTPEGRYFQSYDTVIAFVDNDGKVTLDKGNWDYSATTSKYRNVFLREDTKETKARIKDKTYKLANLN